MSAPSGPIQNIPPGLLGLLNLKNTGRLPDVLNGTVQPTVDLQDWWLRSVAIQLVATPSRSVAPGVVQDFVPFVAPNDITVPGNEWWWVQGYTLQFLGNASTISYACPAVRYVGGVSPYFRLGVGITRSLIAGQSELVTAERFWLPPGSSLGFYLDIVGAGGTADVTCRGLAFSRLQV